MWLYKKRLEEIGSTIIVEMKDMDLKMCEYDSERKRKRISRKLLGIMLEMKMLKVVSENQWMRKLVVSEYGARVARESRRMKRSHKITPLAEKFIFDHIEHCTNKYIANQIGVGRTHLQLYLRKNRVLYQNKKQRPFYFKQTFFPVFYETQKVPNLQ